MTSPVDAYIAKAAEASRQKLGLLRDIILSVAPDAVERISYGMPHYDWEGRLAYFALCKNHIGLYVPPPVTADLKADLEHYVTTKSAVHFPLDKKLPAGLIKKLIKARMKINRKLAAQKK